MRDKNYNEERFVFWRWMSMLRLIPNRQVIESKFGVSKATACRWIRAWKDANGLI